MRPNVTVKSRAPPKNQQPSAKRQNVKLHDLDKINFVVPRVYNDYADNMFLNISTNEIMYLPVKDQSDCIRFEDLQSLQNVERLAIKEKDSEIKAQKKKEQNTFLFDSLEWLEIADTEITQSKTFDDKISSKAKFTELSRRCKTLQAHNECFSKNFAKSTQGYQVIAKMIIETKKV